MTPRLAKTVWVTLPGKSQRVRLPAGSSPPEWTWPLITNPAAWSIPPEKVDTADELYSVAQIEQMESGEPAMASDEEDPVPPRHGPGSGREAWVAYAETHQVEIDEDAPRSEIIAVLDDAGIRTE